MFKKWVSLTMRMMAPLTASHNSRFSVRDDVSSSTSLKSSVQRHIRTGFCEQIPFLNLPAYSDTPKESKAPPAATEPKEEEAEEEVTKSSGKGGKKKGGGKKGGKNKGGKEEVDEAAQEGEEQQLAIIDEIWPKKDALGISKWLVAFVGRDARRADIDAFTVRTISTYIPLMACLSYGSISMDHLFRH